ncbi:MAG: hypothetical protein EKK54_06300 [Neisseriaceae bacterium]|nr:MAG: hypothetical protein EKK54_06300 [Neisseriaceae bacterium]
MAEIYNLIFSAGFLLFFCLSSYSIYLFGKERDYPRINFISLVILIVAGYVLIYHYLNRNQAISEEEISMIVNGITPIPLEIKYWWKIAALLIVPIGFSFSTRNTQALIVNVLSVIVFAAYWLVGLQKTLSALEINYAINVFLTAIPVVLFEYNLIKERVL